MLRNEQETAEFLRKGDQFLILTHKKPDGDTVGSAAALCRALRALGKTAYVLPNPELTPRYEELLLPLYPQEEKRGMCVVSVDVADRSLLPANAAELEVEFSIDHHDRSRQFSRQLYHDASAAATGEMVAGVIQQLGAPVTKEIANALYTAISTDTGCFRFANTTPRTHRIVAELMECGADWYELNRKLFSVKTPTQIAVEGAVLGSLRFYQDGIIAVAVVSREMRRQTGATEDDLDGISSLAYQIEGVEAGITVFEQPDGYKISLRSGERVDAAKVCAKFGGGGHHRAAGCFFTCTLEEVVSQITDAVAVELERSTR